MPPRDRTAPRWTPHADEARLVEEWAGYAVTIARDYYLPGCSDDDVRQEALIGLLVGIRSYDPARGSTLRSYLWLAVHRWMQTQVRLANTIKADLVNESARVGVSVDGEHVPIVELLPAFRADPADVVERREELARITRAVRALTDLERHWLTVAMNGDQYAFPDERRNKQAENAVDRARVKIRAAA